MCQLFVLGYPERPPVTIQNGVLTKVNIAKMPLPYHSRNYILILLFYLSCTAFE